MTSRMIGSIPENIVLIGRKPYQLTLPEALAETPGEKIPVVEVYVSDADNAKTIESGRTWAKGWGTRDTKNEQPYEVTRPNSPMSGVRILELERRGNGGRAYKVILPDTSYYVDFREDVLVDAILTVGIGPGGVLGGEYVFCRVGSEMKLIRVGSKLHAAMVESTKAKRAPVVELTDLKPGRAYQTKGGLVCVFLGMIDCDGVEFSVSSDYRSYNRDIYKLYAGRYELRGQQAWFDFEGGQGYHSAKPYGSKKTVDTVDAHYVFNNAKSIRVVSNRSVTTDMGATQLSDDPVSEVRRLASSVLVRRLKNPLLSEEVKRYNDWATQPNINRQITADVLAAMVTYELMCWCTLRVPGTDTMSILTADVTAALGAVKMPPILAGTKPNGSDVANKSYRDDLPAECLMFRDICA